jgi:hypothetical protein
VVNLQRDVMEVEPLLEDVLQPSPRGVAVGAR